MLAAPENQIHVAYGKHNEYIQTDVWKRKSKAMRDFYIYCDTCGTTENLTVHHLHYETLGRERMQDMSVKCWPCHEKYEKVKKAEKDKLKARMPVMRNTSIFY